MLKHKVDMEDKSAKIRKTHGISFLWPNKNALFTEILKRLKNFEIYSSHWFMQDK